jgi:uncharacterized glyoxalase superfamily protein PhnB
MTEKTEPPRICPTFRYKDAAAMIAWLEKAFGFTVRAKYANDAGEIQHAELAYGSSIIMLGTAREDDYGSIVGMPGQNGGKSVYVAVDDADKLYARATAEGAKIVQELTDRDYGSREFICRDPEDNIWCFGTYWPKASDPA